MWGLQIGISPMSWGVSLGRNRLNVEWPRFLDEVAAAGYGGVELGSWGYLPTDPTNLRRALGERGLSLAGGQVNVDYIDGNGWAAALERTAETCELIAELGAKRLVLLSTYASPISEESINGDAWRRMVDRIAEIGESADSRGVLAAFHPHAGGGIETEAQIERLLADTNPQTMSLCFDIAHHAYCGGDVIGFLRSHPDRIGHVHLKNVDGEVLQQVRRDHLDFGAAASLGVMTDLEHGMLDLAAIRDELARIRYGNWAVVEQDIRQDAEAPPSVTAAANRRFLRSIGFGEPS